MQIVCAVHLCTVYCVSHVLSVSCVIISQLQSCMESFILISLSFKSLHLCIQARTLTRLCLVANRDSCSFGMLEQGLFLLPYTLIYFCVLICTSLYFYVLLCNSICFCLLPCASVYFYVLFSTSMCVYFYVLLCTFVSCVVCIHLCACMDNY